MSVFTKNDLKYLYKSEINIRQNKCVQLVVEQVKQKVFSQAKEGNTSASYPVSNQNPYYNDEWVKTQILSEVRP
jgi:hypothetical protein